jgi:ABC-2 type transport system ATP-binding protein
MPACSTVSAAIEISDLRHHYGDREALRGVTFRVDRGEIFALLGPNGGGKTTLFKILSTLMRPASGEARVLGYDLAREAAAVRPRLGVVFQNPGLDPKLTVGENLVHHGHLYGLGGAPLRERVKQLLGDLDLSDRANDRVETLSGGLARRTELARGLLHTPELLLLDEPSTGLDPGARRDFSHHLRELRDRAGVTVLLTTHYMEEADELADRLAIVSRGRVIVEGTPEQLKQSLRGEAVEVELADGRGSEAEAVVAALEGVLEASIDGRRLRSRVASGARAIPFILSALEAEGISVESVTTHRPSLDDVYLHYTGREFAAEDEQGRSVGGGRR